MCYLEGLTSIAADSKLRRLTQWQLPKGTPPICVQDVVASVLKTWQGRDESHDLSRLKSRWKAINER